jgi:peptide/nickel transport system substrate-binding protein
VAKKSTNNYWFPPTSVFNLLTNLKDPLLGQKVVRQAISMAIDRDALSKKAEYGYMTPATPNQIVPTATKDWADPSLSASEKKFTYNPDGAKKLLEQAGFKENGSGVMVSPDGKPLKFDLISVSGWTDWNAQASLIADNLKKIGIEVNVQQLQHGAFQSQLQSHSFQLAFGGPNPGPNPYYHFDSLYRTNGAVNYEQYSNAQLDQALSDFSKTTDASAQKQAIYTAQKSIAEDLPTIPLLNAEVLYQYSTAKYTGWPDAKNPYVSPSVWNYPAISIMLQHLKPVTK